jgi:hypothetical protein
MEASTSWNPLGLSRSVQRLLYLYLYLLLFTEYYVGDKIKKNEVGRARSTDGEIRGAYAVLVGKTRGKENTRKTQRKWKNNIKMDVQEVGWWPMDWIDLGQDRRQGKGSCECGNELSGSIICGEFLE